MLRLVWEILLSASFAFFPNAIPFYKSPESPFQSGQANPQELQNKLIGTEDNFRYFANLGKDKIWLNDEDVILESETVRDKNNNKDLGWVINLDEVSLRTQPLNKGRFIRRVARLEKMQALQFVDRWVKVFYKGDTGYVELDTLVTRFDFAYSVMDKKNQWSLASFKVGHELHTKNAEKIKLSDIQALATRKNLGIITSFKKINGLQLYMRQNVTINNIEAVKWYKSHLSEHGIVWWNNYHETNSSKNLISTEELMQKNITAIAFHPKNPQLGIVSAGAIYKTTDGQYWKKMEEFGSHDYPVSINDNGFIYVGNYISKNTGQSFEAFLKWDKITPLVETYLGRPPLFIKIVSYNKLNQQGGFTITIDTGYRKINVITDKFFLNYQVTKFN